MTDPDTIAKRAYELFLARGSEPGHEVDDWLQAEAELHAQAGDAEEDHPTPESSAESPPETDRDRRAARKRGGSARRVARQPQTH